MARMKRTWVSDVPSHVGEKVSLFGWVHARRDHGKLIFFDLRDRSGLLQCVVKLDAPSYETAKSLGSEYVIRVAGEVVRRSEQMINPDLPTGEVELQVAELEILNTAETPPFEIAGGEEAGEELRMTYRYLDLRRERPRKNLEFRYRMTKFIRDFLDER